MLLLTIIIFGLIAFFASAAVLMLSAKWLQAPRSNYRVALIVTLILLGIGLMGLLTYFLDIPGLGLVFGLGGLALTVYLYTRFFQVGWAKAIGIYLISFVLGGIVTFVTLIILHGHVFQAFTYSGIGMTPTIKEGDYLITSKIEKTLAGPGYAPKRGQIITFIYPKDNKSVLIQRVVALPGERVVIKNGKVTVYNQSNPNGFNPDVQYGLTDATTQGDTDLTVPSGKVFVLGDNRSPNGSLDSREWGVLPIANIISVAEYRLQPGFKQL